MDGWYAGSPRLILYIFLQLVDEILHGLDWLPFDADWEWRYRFCKWTHRHDVWCHKWQEEN